jgi:hypothetical protein
MRECVHVASVTSGVSWIKRGLYPSCRRQRPIGRMSTYGIRTVQVGTRREFEIAEIGTEAELNARADRHNPDIVRAPVRGRL